MFLLNCCLCLQLHSEEGHYLVGEDAWILITQWIITHQQSLMESLKLGAFRPDLKPVESMERFSLAPVSYRSSISPSTILGQLQLFCLFICLFVCFLEGKVSGINFLCIFFSRLWCVLEDKHVTSDPISVQIRKICSQKTLSREVENYLCSFHL